MGPERVPSSAGPAWIALLLLLVLMACSHRQYGTATLTWSPVDVANGYNIYRAEEPDGDYLRINADLVREPGYVDQTAKRGKTYHYRVTTVTAAGVESDVSKPASKTID